MSTYLGVDYMKDYNKKYVELLEQLRKMKGNNPKEKELLKRLEKIVYLDTNNKIILDLLENDSDFNQLIEDINKEMDNLRVKIEKAKYTMNSSLLEKYQRQIDGYKKLKNDFVRFYEEQSIESFDWDSLVMDCYSNISKVCFGNDTVFGKKLVFSRNGITHLNDESVQQLYSLMEDEEFSNQVIEGVHLAHEKISISGRIRDEKEVLSYKDVLLRNYDSILQFNTYLYMLEKYQKELKDSKYQDLDSKISFLNKKISREISNVSIRGNYNKNLSYYRSKKNLLLSRIDRVEEIKRNQRIVRSKMSAIYDKLCSEGLEDFLFDTYSKINGDGVLNLSKVVRELDSYQGLEEYFQSIQNKFDDDTTIFKDIRDREKEFMNRSGIHTLDFIHNHFDTACTFVNILENNQKSEVSPKLSLFILRVLGESHDPLSRDIDLSDLEYEELEKWYQENIKPRIHEFEDEFYGISFDVCERDSKDVISNNQYHYKFKK